MNKAIKQTYFAFILLCSIAIWANHCFIGDSNSDKFISTHLQCHDTSNHHETPHSFEIIDFNSVSGVKFLRAPLLADFNGILNVNIKDIFLSNIWQPPKVA